MRHLFFDRYQASKKQLAKLAAAAGVAAALVAGSAQATVIYPTDNGFEEPNLGSASHYASGYAPLISVPGWTFTGFSGVASNGGSGFTVFGATNFNNSDSATSTNGQAAFLQDYNYGNPYTDTSTMSTTITGLVAGAASVTFSIEERIAGYENATVDVNLGGTDLGVFTPGSTLSFNTVTTTATPVTGGSLTLTFTGTGGSSLGETIYIDNVSVNNVPEPATLVMLGLGATGLFAAARRRKRGNQANLQPAKKQG